MVGKRVFSSKKVFLSFIFLATFLTFVCSGRDNFQQEKDFARLVFPSGTEVRAEIVSTPEARAIGLMFREALPSGEGMLFIFEEADFHTFWMLNMKFSIDIIWLSPERHIVHLENSVPPCPEEPCPSYQPMQKALYVIEVPAGFAKKEGLSLGMKVIIQLEK